MSATGYTTDFIGHIDIRPSLNKAERTYLTAFAASRRWREPGGRYAVPIAACRRDTKELYLIRVDDNVVTEEVLRPADRRYVDYPPLAYEALADAENARRLRPKPALRVVDEEAAKGWSAS